MNINGLPPIDTPLHERDPHDCHKCRHSYYDATDADCRYVRCVRTGKMAVFERDDEGQCGPQARFWKGRAA